MKNNIYLSIIIFILGCIDIYYFKILSTQGYLIVFLLNIIIQFSIHYFATNVFTIKYYEYNLSKLIFVFILNCIFLFYKINFINSFNVLGIADASADLMAYRLFECNFCESPKQINLNEPFIIYIYVLISFLSGEYNNGIIWLSFNVILFLTMFNIYRIIKLYYPNILYPWLIPIIFFIFPDVHGINLSLFKDNIILFFCTLYFLINFKFINKIQFGLKEQIFLIFTIIMMYSLRSGLLPLILGLYFFNCVFNPRNFLLISRTFFIAFCVIFLLGQYGYASNPYVTIKKIESKLSPKENIFQDSYNHTFTVSKDESILVKLGTYETSITKLPANFLLKSFFTFLLPLPINKSINLIDFSYKIASLFYLFIFPFVLIGIYNIVKYRKREGLYLFVVFLLLLVTILSAGEMIYPRYRILILPFYLIIFGIGVSSISKTTFFVISLLLIFLILIILFFYYEIYDLLKLLL